MTRRRKKHRPEEIVAKLRDADAMLNAGKRRACVVADQPRSSQRFEAKPRTDEAPLVKRMLSLARAKPRYGYPRIGWLLREDGWRAGLSRVFRLWQREGSKKCP